MATNEKEKINRTKIVETAEILIADHNRADITLAEIATALGVTHAAIYKHFKNKKDLWEAVSTKWFQATIVIQIDTGKTSDNQIDRLYSLLSSFVNAKKTAYNQNQTMFMLNTQYVESNPVVLRTILTTIYQKINDIMGWSNESFQQAELILSAFTVFTLPTFKESWNHDDFDQRFENMWQLVQPGIKAMLNNKK